MTSAKRSRQHCLVPLPQVHALVSNMFPDIDQSSEAYLSDQRHGPIFKLLNKRLFGHSSDSYRHIFPY
jgi:hypothetical protein